MIKWNVLFTKEKRKREIAVLRTCCLTSSSSAIRLTRYCFA